MADLCPLGAIPQLELSSGIPNVGGLLFFYVGGSVNTKQTTYTDSTGGVANTNPIVLNALGMPTGGVGIWLTRGLLYKIVYAPAGDTDPPTSPIATVDNVSGISSPVSADQWIASGLTPTFVNATSFTLSGDQTSAFHVGRRLKTTIGAGTGYHTITASAFGAGVTTVTVNGTTLDSGLSAVSYGLITSTNTSFPAGLDIKADSFVAQGSESTAITPDYGFRDERTVTLTGSPVGRGACSFADARTYIGAGIAEHIHSYQVAQGAIDNDGVIDNYRAYYALQSFTGSAAVTNVSMFHAENPTGAGVITNLYGVYIASLTRGSTDNYAIYTAGATASKFGGPVSSLTSFRVNNAGSNSVAVGPHFALANVAGDRIWLMQLNASNDIDFWNFNGTSWAIAFTMTRTSIAVTGQAGAGTRTVVASAAGVQSAP